MDTLSDRYEGRLFLRRASGEGPHLGRYGLVDETTAAHEVKWVVLMKWWPTEQEACDDAARAARFAIDAHLYAAAATRAAEAIAAALALNSDAPSWQSAVRAQRGAILKRNTLEARLVGAREVHWPDLKLRGQGPPMLRCR